MTTCTVWGIVVAGGSGTRFGSLKQLEPLGDRRVIDWSVRCLTPVCGGVVVVAPAELLDGDRPPLTVPDAAALIAGGQTRSDSVRAGLDALDPAATHVLVHDGARPLASPRLAERVVTALHGGAPAAVPVVPIADSLRTVDGEPVDRSGYLAVQTPQGFDLEVLRRAHRSGRVATDDASLLHQLDIPVEHVEGEATNVKITERHDLATAAALLPFARPDETDEEHCVVRP